MSKGKAKPPKTPDVGGKDRAAAPASEALPGVTDVEWENIQEIDQRDHYVHDLVESLVKKAFNKCQRKMVRKFASTIAVEHICNILENTVQSYFLSTDLEFGDETSWAEDEAPKLSIIDSWMSNKVPVVRTPTQRPYSRLSASTSSTLISEVSPKGAQNSPDLPTQVASPRKFSSPVTRSLQTKRINSPVKFKIPKHTPSPLAQGEAEILLSPVIPPASGTCLLKGVPKTFTGSLRASQKMNSKPLVEFDSNGKITNVTKIGVEQLPRLNRHRTSYKIESQSETPERSKKGKRVKPVSISQKSVKCNTRIIRKSEFPCGISLDEVQPRATTNQVKRSPRIVDLAPIRMMNPQKVKPSDIVT